MKSAFDDIRLEEYSEAVEARKLGARLVAEVEEHAHLGTAKIGYAFRDDELRRHGKVTWAECILVERILQSEKRWGRLVKWALIHHVLHVEELPDFLILIDRNIWEGLDTEERIALLDHELSHAWYAVEDDGETQKFHQDGSPWWAIRGHDVEEFEGVIARRGLWRPSLVTFARTIVDQLADEAGYGATVHRIA